MNGKSDSINVGSGVACDDDERGSFPNSMPWEEDTVDDTQAVQEPDETYEPEPLEKTNEKLVISDLNDEFIYNKVGEKVRWNKPWFKGQFDKDGMRQLGFPETKIFHLGDPEQLNEYNELCRRTGAEGEDPSVVIQVHDRQFWEGNYIALVTYRKVWYLLPKQG